MSPVHILDTVMKSVLYSYFYKNKTQIMKIYRVELSPFPLLIRYLTGSRLSFHCGFQFENHFFFHTLITFLEILSRYNTRSCLSCGHREDGHLGSVKNFKTPFFKRYWKFLPWGHSYRSKTSPIFFFSKYLNKYSC